MRTAITIYSISMIGILAWLLKEFGPSSALGIGLILAMPLMILSRMHSRATKPLKREYLYTMLLAASSFVVSWYLVAEWYDKDEDDAWRWYCQCMPFVIAVRCDSRFIDVKIDHRFVKATESIDLTGSVKTEADHEQLKILLEEWLHRDGRYCIKVDYPGKEGY